MTWLVTGGAGYIGGHVVRRLLATGREVVVLDDLSRGEPSRLPPGVSLARTSVTSVDAVASVLWRHGVIGVMHLAGVKAAPESVSRPLWYYRQNVDGVLSLLEAITAVGVPMLVFSSSAAVYGSTTDDRVTEAAATRPDSPYGQTKLVGEWLVTAAARASRLRYVCLRYFNVAGADGAELRERARSNLIPRVLDAVTAGRPALVYGGDYPTFDGSCVRDFVHVSDVADAHVAMADALEQGRCGTVYNVGRGHGYSVREVLAAVRAVVGGDFPVTVIDRRPGDPAHVVADVRRIEREVGWRARLDLTDMVRSEWQARGYAERTGPAVAYPAAAD